MLIPSILKSLKSKNLNKELFEAVPIFLDSNRQFILLDWEYVYKGDIGPLEHLWKMYSAIQTKAKNKCMLQGIQGNLQFMNMDGKFHLDGEDNQTVFIMMLAYHDIDENMGGEFYHESSGEKISFKQGRVMEMTASDSHRADAFNVPYIPRFSIKFTGLNSNNTSIYNKERI